MTLPNVHPKRMADEHLLPAALLETGDTLNFLEVRKHSLRVKIKDSKLSAATGKVSGLSAALGGGLLYFTLANPLGALLACGGLAAYGLAVGAQWLQTGKLHPFPLTSKTADESDEELSASTLTGGSLQIARSHIHEEASYLEPREKAEYELLHHAPQGLLNAVSSVAPAQRWACYCFLLDAHRTGNLDDYRDRATLETVLGNSSVYHSHLPEAAERFPEIGLESAVEVPSLPTSPDTTLPAVPVATSSPIGATTKFGAIEVPDSRAGNSPQTFDVTYDLGTNPQSALIAGVPGAGKGMIASNAIRHLKAKRPELTVMVIDPKADQKESGYWLGVADVIERLAFAENDPDDCATWLLLKIQQYQSLPTPKLLVMDEGAVIVQFLKLAHKDIKAMGRLKAFIAHISSMGDSAESWLWFITQMVNVDDLGISGGFRSIFRAIAVVAPKNINAVNAFLATTFVPMPSGGMEEIMSLMKQSPVNRAFYDGKSNQWYLMPELENHSGYDRDSRTHLKGSLPQPEKPSTDPRQSLEKLYHETQSLPAESVPLIDEETDFDRLMKWFESHPTLTPTIAELKSVHKFKPRGEIELEDLLDAARQMKVLRCHSNGKANRYQWLGEFSLDNLDNLET